MIFFYASKKEKKEKNFSFSKFPKNKRNASGWAGAFLGIKPSLDEQIKKLKDHGVVISDEAFARNVRLHHMISIMM